MTSPRLSSASTFFEMALLRIRAVGILLLYGDRGGDGGDPDTGVQSAMGQLLAETAESALELMEMYAAG